MARTRKAPKPYTLKSERGERPYRYSTEYYASRGFVHGPEVDAWRRRYSPARRNGAVA